MNSVEQFYTNTTQSFINFIRTLKQLGTSLLYCISPEKNQDKPNCVVHTASHSMDSSPINYTDFTKINPIQYIPQSTNQSSTHQHAINIYQLPAEKSQHFLKKIFNATEDYQHYNVSGENCNCGLRVLLLSLSHHFNEMSIPDRRKNIQKLDQYFKPEHEKIALYFKVFLLLGYRSRDFVQLSQKSNPTMPVPEDDIIHTLSIRDEDIMHSLTIREKNLMHTLTIRETDIAREEDITHTLTIRETDIMHALTILAENLKTANQLSEIAATDIKKTYNNSTYMLGNDSISELLTALHIPTYILTIADQNGVQLESVHNMNHTEPDSFHDKRPHIYLSNSHYQVFLPKDQKLDQKENSNPNIS